MTKVWWATRWATFPQCPYNKKQFGLKLQGESRGEGQAMEPTMLVGLGARRPGSPLDSDQTALTPEMNISLHGV